eukprot:EG_transcript_45131
MTTTAFDGVVRIGRRRASRNEKVPAVQADCCSLVTTPTREGEGRQEPGPRGISSLLLAYHKGRAMANVRESLSVREEQIIKTFSRVFTCLCRSRQTEPGLAVVQQRSSGG